MTVRISIIGATLTGNRGAEAMAETVIARIREKRPDAEFSLFSYYPAFDRAALSDEAINIYSATPFQVSCIQFPFALCGWLLRKLGVKNPPVFFPQSIRALWRSDALIDLAGVSFVDGREKFLPYNILTIWPAMLLGVPAYKFSQAVGSFENPLNRYAANIFLTRCKQVFARGEHTAKHLGDLRQSQAVSRADDVAFLFEPDDTLTGNFDNASLEAKIAAIKIDTQKIIGVCPSSVLRQKSGTSYAQSMAKIIEQLVATGSGVVLFPNATRAQAGEQMRNNDLPVIREIRNLLSEGARKNCVFVDADVNAAAIKLMMAQFDLIVSSRFHAMIGALSTGIPVVVVGWSHKYLEVMALFGQEAAVFDHAQLNVATILEAIENLLSEENAARATISKNLVDVRDCAMTQFDVLLDDLKAA